MAKGERIRVEATFVKDGPLNNCRAKLPAIIRDKFGAKPGDKLIIEEGCEQTVMRATLRKGNLPYFIITMERGAPAVKEDESTPAAPAAAESLEAMVERKMREKEK